MVTNNPNLSLNVSDSIICRVVNGDNIRGSAIVLEISKLGRPGIGHLNPYCLTPWTWKVLNDMCCIWLQSNFSGMALDRTRSIIGGRCEVCYSVQMVEADFSVTLEGVAGVPLESVRTWVDEDQRALSKVASDGDVEVEDSRHVFRYLTVEESTCRVIWVGLVDRYDEMRKLERSGEVGLAGWDDIPSPKALWASIHSRNQQRNDSKTQHY